MAHMVAPEQPKRPRLQDPRSAFLWGRASHHFREIMSTLLVSHEDAFGLTLPRLRPRYDAVPLDLSVREAQSSSGGPADASGPA